MANVKYVPYGRVIVSNQWRIVLREADRQKVRFHVTSGHRTFEQQEQLVEERGLYHPITNPYGAAWPSHDAPHIYTGRPNHAIDVSTYDGGEQRLQNWLRKNGVAAVNNVTTEGWHLFAPRDDLARLAMKIKRRNRRKPPRRGARRISARGLRFLIRQEGVRRYAYNDSEGHATFGVGHLIHRGSVTLADREKWGTPDKPKSMVFVLKILRRDLIKFNRAVREATEGVKLHRYEFDACVSLAFNIGTEGFRRSTVALRIHQRRFRRAANAFLLWNRPAVLLPRRRRERRLFLRGY